MSFISSFTAHVNIKIAYLEVQTRSGAVTSGLCDGRL